MKKKKKIEFTFEFKPSESDRTADEIVNELVNRTIQKVLSEQENDYNIIEERQTL
jgi:hypothetical protein